MLESYTEHRARIRREARRANVRLALGLLFAVGMTFLCAVAGAI